MWLPQLRGISQGHLGPTLPLEAREMQGSTSQPTLPLSVPAGESRHLLNLFPHLWRQGPTSQGGCSEAGLGAGDTGRTCNSS